MTNLYFTEDAEEGGDTEDKDDTGKCRWITPIYNTHFYNIHVTVCYNYVVLSSVTFICDKIVCMFFKDGGEHEDGDEEGHAGKS